MLELHALHLFRAFIIPPPFCYRTDGTKYQVKDAMYRGPPPSSYFSGPGPPHQGALDGTHCKIISPSPNATTASSAWNNDPHAHTPAPPRLTSIPSSQRQATTASATERQDFHTTPTSISARFAHALRLNRLKAPMSNAWHYGPYPHTAAPPRPTSIPSSQRQAPTASERKVAQCKLLIFGIAFVGIALIPLLYSDQDCSDCNTVDPCPDDQENSRPEDFAARVVVAVLLFIPGLLLLFCAFKPSEICIMSCTAKGGGGGGFAFGGGCGGGGCGGC